MTHSSSEEVGDMDLASSTNFNSKLNLNLKSGRYCKKRPSSNASCSCTFTTAKSLLQSSLEGGFTFGLFNFLTKTAHSTIPEPLNEKFVFNQLLVRWEDIMDVDDDSDS
jgi:hypothetical protein